MEDIKSILLNTILSKILTETVVENLSLTSLELLILDSNEILNNEVSIWISQLEGLYPSIAKKIAFKRPDYDEAGFYTLKYSFEDNKITIEELA